MRHREIGRAAEILSRGEFLLIQSFAPLIDKIVFVSFSSMRWNNVIGEHLFYVNVLCLTGISESLDAVS